MIGVVFEEQAYWAMVASLKLACESVVTIKGSQGTLPDELADWLEGRTGKRACDIDWSLVHGFEGSD